MLLEKLAKFGVLPRDAVKNDRAALRVFLHKKFAVKVPKKGRVFYELTERALPLLEEYRHILLHKAQLQARLAPNSKFHRALLGELRFLDDQHSQAPEYRLLGDWQIRRPVVAGQLLLSQRRYYQDAGLA